MPLGSILSLFLNRRVTISRCTRTKDASGSTIETWANVATNVAAREWTKKKSDAQSDFNRRDWVQEYEWAFGSDPSIVVGDRIIHGAAYYDVVAVTDFSHDEIMPQGLYVVKTFKRRKE